MLTCDKKVKGLPIHASYRTDPTSSSVETVVRSAVEFAAEATGGKPGLKEGTKTGLSKAGKSTKKVHQGKSVVSKKSMN